jgi:hypothetical protein
VPIVVKHVTVADQLGPSANVGAAAQQRVDFAQNMDLAQFQYQQDLQDERMQFAQEQAAAENALRAAALVDRRRENDLDRAAGVEVARMRGDNALANTDLRGEQQASLVGLRAGYADQQRRNSAVDRMAQADHVSQLRAAEDQARSQGRLINAMQLQKQREAAQARLQQSQQAFATRQQAVARDFQERMADKRAADIGQRQGNQLEFNKQKAIHDNKLTGLAERIEQLNKRWAITSPDKQAAVEAEIETTMDEYEAATKQYDAWLNNSRNAAPATQPTSAPQTVTGKDGRVWTFTGQYDAAGKPLYQSQ